MAILYKRSSILLTRATAVAISLLTFAFLGSAIAQFRGVDGGSTIDPRNGTGTSSAPDTVPHDCNYSYNLGNAWIQEGRFAQAYDTLRSFVERCPLNPYAPSAFGDMSGAVQNGGDGPFSSCWLDFRTWLLSALPWNTSSVQYFCADVETIGGTFGSPSDTTWDRENYSTNSSLAVLQWLIQNPLCNNPDDQEEYVNTRGSQAQTWLDNYPNLNGLDTTLPSMHDLGLDSVLKYGLRLGVHSAPNVAAAVLLNAVVQPNPATDHTTLSLTIGREAYVRVEVIDLLGRVVPGISYEGTAERGTNTIPISTNQLATGSYYLHISATGGETKMVKFVKER
jgi:hypothetical protein